MSKLHFDFQFRSGEMSNVDLPVEVRGLRETTTPAQEKQRGLTLIQRSSVSRSVDVDPGVYWVTARLPSGHELSARVAVQSGRDVTVVLKPDPEDVSSNEDRELSHFIGGVSLSTPWPELDAADPDAVWGDLQSLGGETLDMRLRAFQGNLIGRAYVEQDPASWSHTARREGDGVTFEVPGRDAVQWLQLVQRGHPPLNVMLPAYGQSDCQVAVLRRESEAEGVPITWTVEVYPQNRVAHALLRYRDRGDLEQAAAAATSPAMDGENLLAGKARDPIGAVIGAYSLLRFGHLDRLHDWTGNLMRRFPELPDGAAIQGEHFARLGKHAQALDAFLALKDRGLPLFTDGLAFALQRLDLYLQATTETEAVFSPELLRRAGALRHRFERWSPWVNFGGTTLSFTGFDPALPDAKPFTHELGLVAGMDLTLFLP